MQSNDYQILWISENSSVEKNILQMLQESEHCSFSVRKPNDSQTIVSQLDSTKWDAVLWDLSSTGEAGLAKLKEIGVRGYSVPFVTLVSENQKQLGKRTIELGAKEYLPTNVLSKDLLE